MTKFPKIDATYCKGTLEIQDTFKMFPHNLLDIELGIQISDDGRLWVCINGSSFIRFRPHKHIEDKK
ncbi:MAG: hypothetical protein DRO67_00090 [Candidatus Asgardarchaeum californiense]|nr:MAG: hypothetical protein DRO67_00090 [Candidatus Asgardarchaeum californiense]